LMSPPSSRSICESIKKIRNWNFEKIPEKKFSWDSMIDKIESLYKY
jgi:hypothetical protein